MTAGDMAIIGLMALGVVMGVGEPLLRHVLAGKPDSEEAPETERLLLQKDMVYGAIRDLDFDFQTHKVDQADYVALRQQLEDEAIQLLQQLDAVDPRLGLEGVIEQQVQALRQRPPLPSSEDGVLGCPDCRFQPGPEAHFCPVCGHPLQQV